MNRFVQIALALAVTVSLLAFVAPPQAPAQADATETYIVLYKGSNVPKNAGQVIADAGGTLVYSYDRIGVAIARSGSTSFRDTLVLDGRIEGAASTAGFGVPIDGGLLAGEGFEILEADALAAADGEPLAYLQWDMPQIHVPEAHMVTTGSPDVLVGDIDTGLAYTHPDLAANVDVAHSVSCIGGVPNPDPAAWADNYGHGTHTAGTIVAAVNGIGIYGIAPNARLAAIKGCGDDGYCWPESIVCSFMWAAEHKMDVTNNSYFVDPNEFNCHNDKEQHAIWKAVQRAVRYAQSQGVTVVTSAGNSNVDMAHIDDDLTNACNDLPVELAGVIGVSANGYLMEKAYYSSYGVGTVEVTAPGGDRRFQIPPPPIGNGRVLSTVPGGYAWAQGTSMAAPHVTGVVALLISQFGKMPQGRVQAMITQTADPVPCPEEFNPGPPYGFAAECQGGIGYNSFFGSGQVNAYRAVTHTP